MIENFLPIYGYWNENSAIGGCNAKVISLSGDIQLCSKKIGKEICDITPSCEPIFTHSLIFIIHNHTLGK
jgi:hypothetical protein